MRNSATSRSLRAALVSVAAHLSLAAIVLATGVFPPGMALWLFLLLPPANWSAIAIDNVTFLLFPYRRVAEDPGDVSFVGRSMPSIALKLVTLSLIGVSEIGRAHV